jgi:hypothetical protein
MLDEQVEALVACMPADSRARSSDNAIVNITEDALRHNIEDRMSCKSQRRGKGAIV